VRQSSTRSRASRTNIEPLSGRKPERGLLLRLVVRMGDAPKQEWGIIDEFSCVFSWKRFRSIAHLNSHAHKDLVPEQLWESSGDVARQPFVPALLLALFEALPN
jgi:hypothetical protein